MYCLHCCCYHPHWLRCPYACSHHHCHICHPPVVVAPCPPRPRRRPYRPPLDHNTRHAIKALSGQRG